MAHFYGFVHGARGRISLIGHKTSGLEASVNGWNLGCDVLIEWDKRRKLDVVTVWKTNGSAGRGRRQIARFTIPPSQERTHDGSQTSRRTR